MNQSLQAAAALAGLLMAAGPSSPAAQPAPTIVLAAGDIAVCGRPGAMRTAALLDRLAGTILAVGDLAYGEGTKAQFERCYGSTWGRHKARTRPVPGNHEYRSPGARPYFALLGETGRRRGTRLLQLRCRRLARRRPQQQYRRRPGIRAASLAAPRPRGLAGALRPRLLASPALQLRPPRRQSEDGGLVPRALRLRRQPRHLRS